jgi:Tol biopolymer transport system component
MPVATGDRIGPYEIVAWVGAGGMGEVYRARDPRIGRDVAIKLIAQTMAADVNRVRRFEQEARAVGQLSHPNILAIFDVGTHAGSPYIVSELLEGESLRARLDRGSLPLRKVVDYARQIAEGLAAAHDRFIVHRDIKPDNLFVTLDGRVKILDFGIAKLRGSNEDEDASGTAGTGTGATMALGSAAYMSPEQVRGEAVDARSDVFSVGAIVHEMLSGRPAFSRDTAAESMAAILHEEPAAPLPADISVALARIVSRCLEKTREERFQSARDLAFSLDVLSHTGASVAGPPVTARRYSWGIALGLAVLIVAAGVVTWRVQSEPTPTDDDRLAKATLTPFADWETTEALAEISPDGQFVAFLSDRDGQFDVWLSQVGTRIFRNLTTTLPTMNPPGVVLHAFGFTGDGTDIWFSESGNPGDRKMRMPLLGGNARPFLLPGDITPTWSPDGTRVAYVNNRNGDPLFVADSAGADARQILDPVPGVLHNHNPVWSPDGEWIYFVRGLEPTDAMDVWRIRSSGGPPERMTELRATVNFLAPIDARTLLYVARAEDRSGPWLWALDVTRKTTRRVSWGLEQYTSVAASRDGRRVVATVANPTSSLWTTPISDRISEERHTERYPVTTPRALAPRFSGTSLFYLSAGSKGDGLWRLGRDQAVEIWRGVDGTLSEPPAIAPDGSRLAVVVGRRGRRQLTIMSPDGTNARTLAETLYIQGAASQSTADWSPDGAWLVIGGSDEHGPGLFKVPIDGSPPVRLTAGQATNPVCSPQGNLIVYAGAFVGGQALLQAIRPDGTPVEMPRVTVRQGGYRFAPDGKSLIYLPTLQSRDFWLLDLATRHQRQLTHVSDRGRVQSFDITPDGRSIVFDRLQDNSDIVLIDLPD